MWETRGFVLMLKTVNVQSVGRQMYMSMHAFFDLAPVNLADSGDPSADARLADLLKKSLIFAFFVNGAGHCSRTWVE